ncbi:MAG TPA: zf-HC2 domain-containing protein [Blastocatellia bacterium]|nr:zf-HC2 domain-containing protein [Blastocatellia bacterium]
MICTECQPRLSDYIDGHLSPGERLRVQEHLSFCVVCAVIHQDLNLIVVTCRELPTHTPSPIWQRIQAEIGTEITANRSFWARLWSKRFNISLSLPQLVLAASLVIAGIVSLSVIERVSPGSIPGISNSASVAPISRSNTTPAIPDDVKKSIETYSGHIQERMPTWDPQMRDTFERNMAAINLSLDRVQQELAVNPDDDGSRDLLRSAYDKKLKLLEDFSEF